jgi:hypothetical protein
MRSLICLLLLAQSLGDRPVEWKQLQCPSSTGDTSCTYANSNRGDAMAISLFFQAAEGLTERASFTCKGKHGVEVSRLQR